MKKKNDLLQSLIFLFAIIAAISAFILAAKFRKNESVETAASKAIYIAELTTESTSKTETHETVTESIKATTKTQTSKTTTSTIKPLSTAAGEKTKLDGKFKITCYTPYSDGGRWGYSTSTGVKSKHLATCAVDPSVIPLGSTIEVNGLTLLCCDIGSAVKGRHIDIFYDGTASEAREWLSDFGEYQEVEIYG